MFNAILCVMLDSFYPQLKWFWMLITKHCSWQLYSKKSLLDQHTYKILKGFRTTTPMCNYRCKFTLLENDKKEMRRIHNMVLHFNKQLATATSSMPQIWLDLKGFHRTHTNLHTNKTDFLTYTAILKVFEQAEFRPIQSIQATRVDLCPS